MNPWSSTPARTALGSSDAYEMSLRHGQTLSNMAVC